jgi:hypothetical protein
MSVSGSATLSAVGGIVSGSPSRFSTGFSNGFG